MILVRRPIFGLVLLPVSAGIAFLACGGRSEARAPTSASLTGEMPQAVQSCKPDELRLSLPIDRCERRPIAIPRCPGCGIQKAEHVDCGEIRDLVVLASDKRYALLVDSDHGRHLVDEQGAVTRQPTIHHASFLLTDDDLVVSGERWMRESEKSARGFVVRGGQCSLAENAVTLPFLSADGVVRGWSYERWIELPKDRGQAPVYRSSGSKSLFDAQGAPVSPALPVHVGWTYDRALVAQRWGDPEQLVRAPTEADPLSSSTPVGFAAPLGDVAGASLPAVVGWISQGKTFEMMFPAPRGEESIPFRIALGSVRQGCERLPLTVPRPAPSRSENRSGPALFRTSDRRLWLAYVERHVPCSYARPASNRETWLDDPSHELKPSERPRVESSPLLARMIPSPPSWDCKFGPASDRLIIQRVQDPTDGKPTAARVVASINLPSVEDVHPSWCRISSPTLSVGLQGTRAILATGTSVFTLEMGEL